MSRVLARAATSNNISKASSSKYVGGPSVAAVWLGDVAAYPLIAVMSFASAMSIAFAAHMIATDPDARIAKGSRKKFYRGKELMWEKQLKKKTEGITFSSSHLTPLLFAYPLIYFVDDV